MVKESNNVQEKTAGSFLNNRPEQSGEVIDLLELFWELVKHWKHILLAMLIGAVLAGSLLPGRCQTFLSGRCFHFYYQQ